MSATSGTHTILESAARTAAVNSDVQANPTHRGVHLVIDITAVPGAAPSLTFTIQGYDPVSGKTWTILASAALVGVGTTILKVYPGLPVAANASANDILPPNWRVSVAAGNANEATYSVTAQLVV